MRVGATKPLSLSAGDASAAVVAQLEPQHQQTAALSAAVSVSVQAQSATGAWQRKGLSGAAVVDALRV